VKHGKPSVNKIKLSNTDRDKIHQLYTSREDKLLDYSDQLLWWNKKINLVGPSVSRETLRLHVMHSLIPEAMGLLNGAEYIVDAGTGSGLPGIPLAIAGESKSFDLVDTVQKKIFALKQICRELKLKNCSARQMSIGEFNPSMNTVLVSKHAFEISDLFRMTNDKGYFKYVLYKGYNEGMNELNFIKAIQVNIYEIDSMAEGDFYREKAIFEIFKS